jgi:hypothetical protein
MEEASNQGPEGRWFILKLWYNRINLKEGVGV